MDLRSFDKSLAAPQSEGLMPMLFVGHGSPMNAIEKNRFTDKWQELGNKLPRPSAILCISAHWETNGTFVTAMPKPPTIHDFGGFPPELYDVIYPAPGSPDLAYDITRAVHNTEVLPDTKWGLDHGAWSVIMNMYPDAGIPVLEFSLNWHLTPSGHYDLARELEALRRKGVLIIGSGNLVHNLRMVAWDHAADAEFGFDWAHIAGEKFKNLIVNRDDEKLINYTSLGREVQLAVPTPDHFLPLLYILALRKENEETAFFNDAAVMGSLSMTSLIVGG